jgi:hypothetical protein
LKPVHERYGHRLAVPGLHGPPFSGTIPTSRYIETEIKIETLFAPARFLPYTFLPTWPANARILAGRT